jgi:outer membrane protein TolC
MKHYHLMIFLSILICIGLAISSIEAQASDSSLQAAQPQVSLSLPEAIQRALEQNFDIQIEQLNPEIAAEDIQKAKAAFAPTLNTGSSYTHAEDSAGNNLSQNTVAVDMGIAQQLKTGDAYQIKAQTQAADTGVTKTTLTDNSSVTLTLTHPFLKNRGRDVNTAQIVIAEKNQEISSSKLRAKIIDLITQIEDTYWNLLLARGVLEADRYSLQLAYDLVKMNEAQVKAGTLAPIEMLQAKATAASREVLILSDEQQVRNMEDELKRLLNIAETDPLWQAELVPTTSAEAIQPAVSLDESIRQALANREELRQLQTSFDIQGISVKTAQNQLLPELNLQGTVGVTGADTKWGDSWNNLINAKTYSVGVGLNLSYPLGNQTAKSMYRKAKLEQEQAQLSLQNMEQQIITQVREAVRAIDTSAKQIEAAKVAEQLAQKQAEAEQKKFQEGLTTNFQVLSYQEKLATAQNDYTKALVSYQKALVSLDQAIGTTLQKYNTVVEGS